MVSCLQFSLTRPKVLQSNVLPLKVWCLWQALQVLSQRVRWAKEMRNHIQIIPLEKQHCCSYAVTRFAVCCVPFVWWRRCASWHWQLPYDSYSPPMWTCEVICIFVTTCVWYIGLDTSYDVLAPYFCWRFCWWRKLSDSFLKQCSRAMATVNKTMNIFKLSSPQHEKKAIVSQLKCLSLNWRMRAYDLPQKTLENDY